MHITFCHNETEYLCDAQSIFLQRLMPALKAMGHEPSLLLISPRKPQKCALTTFCLENNIPFESTYSLGSMTNNIRWCVSKLRKDPPDVFVPNHCYWALYAGKWAIEAGIPSVCVLHSDDQVVRGLIKFFGQSHSPFKNSAFVAVSRAIRDVVQSMDSDVPTYVIPYGLVLPAKVVDPPQEKVLFCYFGRLVQEQKRIKEMTVSLCQIAKKYPKVECHIWGGGQDEDVVRNIIRSNGTDTPVFLHEPVPASQVYEKMRQHHVIVLLSDYEGTPLSLLEGMANGLVPIVMDIGGGVGDLVKDGFNGLVVKDRDADFEENVEKLLNNRPLLSELSVNARETIEEKHSIEIFTKKWIVMFNDLCNTNIRPSRVKKLADIHIPHEFRFPGVHYFPWYIDPFAKAYAAGRYILNKFI